MRLVAWLASRDKIANLDEAESPPVMLAHS
jgi:hypothetical protein